MRRESFGLCRRRNAERGGKYLVRRKEEKRRPIIFVSHMGRMETEKGDNLLGEGKRHYGPTQRQS